MSHQEIDRLRHLTQPTDAGHAAEIQGIRREHLRDIDLLNLRHDNERAELLTRIEEARNIALQGETSHRVISIAKWEQQAQQIRNAERGRDRERDRASALAKMNAELQRTVEGLKKQLEEVSV